MFVLFGWISLLEGVARFLPTETVEATIIDKRSFMGSSGSQAVEGVGSRSTREYRLLLRYADGEAKEISCPREAYRWPEQSQIQVERLPLLKKEVRLYRPGRPGVPGSLTGTGDEGESYSLLVGVIGMLALAAPFNLGLAGYLVWKLKTRPKPFSMAILGFGVGVAALFGTWWWTAV